VTGDFGLSQVSSEAFDNPDIISMMGKLTFKVDPEIDRQFPQRRICRAEIITNDGQKYISSDCEPRGEAHENIGIDWIRKKFERLTRPVLKEGYKDILLDKLEKELDFSIVELVDEINNHIKISS
jgi:2-methylcitrate dehydratase PrpD